MTQSGTTQSIHEEFRNNLKKINTDKEEEQRKILFDQFEEDDKRREIEKVINNLKNTKTNIGKTNDEIIENELERWRKGRNTN